MSLADRLLAELEITPTGAASPAGTLAPSESFRQHDLHWVQPSDRPDFNALRAIKPRGRIAVVVHIYYEDLWTEISAALDNIDEPFDLFVTLVAGKSNDLACALKQSWPFAHILVVENHGRDILPFLSIARTEILFRYEFVCKLHTKRSLWREDGERWRQELIKGVLGSRHAVRCILGAFRTDPDLGLVVADGQMFSGRELWTGNERHLTRLFREFGMDQREFDQSFAGGSIFWIRSCLLGPICDLPISFDDFELEPLGSDGGLAHAVERLISLICYEAGMVIKETSGILAPSLGRRELQDSSVNTTPRGAETDEILGGGCFSTQAEQYEQQLREQSTQVLALQKARMETALRAALAARDHEQVRAALAAAERGKASSEEGLMRLRAENAEIVGSIAWRATQRLVRLRGAPRAIERMLRRAFKTVWRTVTSKLPSQLLKRRSTALTTAQVVAEPVSALTVAEATRRRFSDLEPLRTRPDPRSGRRISIVTDSVNPGLLYGGVGTAIALGALLARRAGADLRLITRHQMADPGHLKPVLDAFGISWKGDIDCVFAPHGGGTVVPMFDGDILLTTSWWTTQAAMRTVEFASDRLPTTGGRTHVLPARRRASAMRRNNWQQRNKFRRK